MGDRVVSRKSTWDVIREAPMAWDHTDNEPVSATRRPGNRPPPIPIKVKDASGRPVAQRKLPGVHEAMPSMAPASGHATSNPPIPSGRRQQNLPTTPDRRRFDKPTRELFVQNSFDVTVPGEGTFRVSASTAEEAKQGIVTFFQEDQEGGPKHIDPAQLQVARTPKEEGATAGAVGPQPQTSYESVLRSAISDMVRETVRKKAGGGGYVLYGPNKGKKKKPKPAGEFPTRLAAKKAELARFPPKDPEQLKRARARLDKIAKDPKRRAKAERDDLSGRKKTRKSGAPARERKKTAKESLTLLLARDLQERLFHEDEIPGSPWDERISSLHPDAISSDRKLHALHKGIETASMGSLGDAHKALTKVLRGMAKVHPGDIANDPERGKTFMPVMLDCDGTEIGPVHLYIDGGHVKVEISQDARQQISSLEPDCARDLRGGLMSFQEDHLPKIDGAKKAWTERDNYLDKLHGRLEAHAGKLSGVEHHLLKQLLSKGAKRK